MNDHEAERIAAAMNQLRPDWPIKSLRTLLARPQLADRPRRDVTVALAWIACEAGTATPARVLENGPWWRAAAIEGTLVPRHPKPEDSCKHCGQEFRPDCCDHPTRERIPADPEVTRRIVEALKADLEPTRERPEPREVTHTPQGDAARAILHPTPASSALRTEGDPS